MIIFSSKEKQLMKTKKVMCLLLFLCFSFSSFAQEVTVSGTITETAANTPLPGVSVLLKELPQELLLILMVCML
tara:strand:+ start:367 stop:588 length:222 start_codon:yes stop_codon:yes gene_type:complete